jgi:hypothetical protein
MAKQIGGFTVEGRYFIVQVPDEWQETHPLPAPSPDDLWFDRVTDFKEALNGPWIRKPVKRAEWSESQKSNSVSEPSAVSSSNS